MKFPESCVLSGNFCIGRILRCRDRDKQMIKKLKRKPGKLPCGMLPGFGFRSVEICR